MSDFTIEPRGPFSLAAAAGFLAGFTPAKDGARTDGARLDLAFRLDGTFAPVGVSLVEEGARIAGDVVGTRDVEAAKRQAARILSLDHDATAWPAVGARDAVVGLLHAKYPGLRPVCFASPYEAAVWGVIAHRLRMPQAAAVKRRLAEQHGDPVNCQGRTIFTVPSPARLKTLESIDGLPSEKVARLHGIADAALDGRFDADRLRAQPIDAALAALSELRGVGPWTAGHILLRGAGVADAPAFAEPRVARALAMAYQLDHEPSDEECLEIAESWRPFRTWVAVLLAVHLARTGAWNSPDDARKRGRKRK